MEQATEKQIRFALSLGINNPESFSKEALKELISQKLGESPANEKKAQPRGLEVQKLMLPPNSAVVIHRNERANSYEFGKAGNRFKIYFETPEELQEKILELKNIGIDNLTSED